MEQIELGRLSTRLEIVLGKIDKKFTLIDLIFYLNICSEV